MLGFDSIMALPIMTVREPADVAIRTGWVRQEEADCPNEWEAQTGADC